MRLISTLFATVFPIAVAAEDLPVQIAIGEAVFAPVGDIDLRKNLRTMSTPPYSLTLPVEDMAAFGQFTAAGIGHTMEISVCGQVVLSAVVREVISSPYIAIHNAPKGGLLDQLYADGCP